jgi:hypothetical protein
MEQVTYISTRGIVRKLITLLPLALALAGAWFSVRWYVGDTIAENLDPENRGLETARLAIGLAPDDALAHWRLAELAISSLPPDQINQAIREYEEAVRLSPNDYRFWLSLGRALEQSGNAAKGERAMRRAVELAPAYSYPRWYLGNLLLRSGHDREAFTELRQASEASPELRPQVFSLAWQVYRDSPGELNNAIGPSVAARAAFARYLVDGQLFAEAVKAWNGFSAKEKRESRDTGQAIMKTLLEARHFHQAVELWNDLAPESAERARLNQIIDGGCEQSSGANAGPFGWQLKSTKQAQVSFDARNYHSGAYSLRIVFQAPGKIEFALAQFVAIEPGTQYDVEFFVRTSQLESVGPPVVEVVDGADGAVLGTSPPARSGDNDWQANAITFKTGPKAEAIAIRVNRASCGDNAVCPIFGTVWYDDFNLKRK